MSAQLNPASFAIPTSLYHGYNDMQEVPAKRGRFDDWSNSSGSSPSHSEDLQIDINHPGSAAASSASRSSDEGTVTEDEINGETPTFTELKPTKLVTAMGRPTVTQSPTELPSHGVTVPSSQETPPPQLMVECTMGELESSLPALASVSVLGDIRQEIVVLLSNISEKLTSCSKEDLMLVIGQLKAIISHITGPHL